LSQFKHTTNILQTLFSVIFLQNKPSAEISGLVKQTMLPNTITAADGWMDGPTSTAT